MQIYANLSGQSNVSRYQLGDDYIIVEFKGAGKDGCNTYTYTYSSAGRENIEQMKSLAVAGRGLNSFINSTVKHLYASKR